MKGGAWTDLRRAWTDLREGPVRSHHRVVVGPRSQPTRGAALVITSFSFSSRRGASADHQS